MGRSTQSDPYIERIARQFARSATTYHRRAVVQRMVAERLAHRLPQGEPFAHAFEWGAGTGLLTGLVDERCRVDRWTVNDLSPLLLDEIAPVRSGQMEKQVGDGSQLSFAFSDYDLWLSSSALQWLPQPMEFLLRVLRDLSLGCRVLVSTFGPGNLEEVRSLTGQGLTYPSMTDWQSALKSLPLSSCELFEERIPIHFPSAREVLRHLKETGVTALPDSSERMRTRQQIITFAEQYEKHFTELNPPGVRLTYHPIYIDIHK